MALIPSERLTDWTPGTYTGVPGGIDQYRNGGASERTLVDVTQPPYNADNTGATNTLSAVQDALTAEGSIYLPAGTYDFGGGTLNIPAGYSDMTIRGAGINATTIENGKIKFGASDGWNTFAAVDVTAGLSKDSTSITVSDATNVSVGKLILIQFEDQFDDTAVEAGAVPIMSFSGWDAANPLRRQVTLVTAKVGNVLTISPGIYHAPDAGLGAKVRASFYTHSLVGIEDLEMVSNGAAIPIDITHGYGCWLLNVRVQDVPSYCVQIADSLRIEVRRCELRDRSVGGSNGAALLVNTSAGCLVEDNIIANVQPLLEVNAGSPGNVFAYNLFENEPVAGSIAFGIDSNHGPHNSYNLYEGNVSPNFMSDGYYGGESETTVYRNWFHGTYAGNDVFTFEFSLKRFSRKFNVCGNILGKNGVYLGAMNLGEPNIGNDYKDDPAQITLGDFPTDWKMTGTLSTRTSATAGVITLISGSMRTFQDTAYLYNEAASYYKFMENVTVLTGGSDHGGYTTTFAGGTFSFEISGGTLPAQGTTMTIFPGTDGYQDEDLDVEATMIEKGNYLYGSGGSAGSMSSLGGDTLPNSFFRDSKPSYFASLAWPPFDPTSPNGAGYADIPAGYRFLNNGDDPPAAGGSTISVANVTNFNIL